MTIPPDSSTATTVVVVPTFNEAANIGELLRRVRAAVPDADVLVVDDGSPDGTARIVARHPDYLRRVFLLERDEKQGLGAAYRAGFSWAVSWRYDVVVQMDADLSHPPESLPELLAGLESADITVGSRYVAGGRTRNWPWRRRLVSRAGNTYVRAVLGLRVHDVTAGFKAFRADALLLIGATEASSEGYCFQIENTWRAVRLGLRVTEVPIVFTDRTAGSSKMSSTIVVEALSRVLGWRWVELRHGTGAALLSATRRTAGRGRAAA